MFTLSNTICVNKYLSHWYGIGRGCISYVFQIYVAIDIKIESRYNIKDSSGGKLLIIMRMILVKTYV